MQLNIIYYCLILWIVVEVITTIMVIVKSRIEKMVFAMEKIYVEALVFFLEKKLPKERMLQSLYFSLGATHSQKKLGKILLKAKSCGNLNSSHIYIQNKLNCIPVVELHECILKETGTKEDIHKIKHSFYMMEEMRKMVNGVVFKNNIKVLCEKMLIISGNMALLYSLQNEISLLIFIIVNTTGVILFILLEYESTSLYKKQNEGKLASEKGLIKKTLSPATRLKSFYQFAGGMGLIINISMIVYQFFEKAI